MTGSIHLYGAARSTAALRVRLGLALKALPFTEDTIDLRAGAQRAPAYLEVNPAGLVPTLRWMDGTLLTQSLAILEFLDEQVPTPPLLPPAARTPDAMPAAAAERARVRALAQIVACDIHPLNNLRVLEALRATFEAEEAKVGAWVSGWIEAGLQALEAAAAATLSANDRFLSKAPSPGLADLCLLAQMVNVKRWTVAMEPYPRLRGVVAALEAVPALAEAMAKVPG